MLLISVAIAIGYDSFFRDKSNYNGETVIKTDLNALAEFTVNFASEAPFLYGTLAILLAVVFGALIAFMRKILSPVIRKMLSDFRKKETKKEDEVKFPEK